MKRGRRLSSPGREIVKSRYRFVCTSRAKVHRASRRNWENLHPQALMPPTRMTTPGQKPDLCRQRDTPGAAASRLVLGVHAPAISAPRSGASRSQPVWLCGGGPLVEDREGGV